jgi:hypothetical protein
MTSLDMISRLQYQTSLDMISHLQSQSPRMTGSPQSLPLDSKSIQNTIQHRYMYDKHIARKQTSHVMIVYHPTKWIQFKIKQKTK